AERLRLTRKHVFHAFYELHLDAHARECLRHLNADRTRAEDDEALGKLLQPGGLAVRPDAVELAKALDRRDHRVRAGRDHDVCGLVGVAGDLDPAGPGYARGPANQVDALLVEPLDRTGVVVVGNLEVAPSERGAHIEL